MKRLGVIDIGSNSVRLVICEITEAGTFKIIDDLKESLRLGEDVEDLGIIGEEKILSTLSTLKTFKVLCDTLKVDDILAVATEALRKAENSFDFIEKIKDYTGISVRVLSGEEEAKYDASAVMHSMYTSNSIIVDIGGASTELIWVYNNKIMEFISLPFGSVNLTKRYNLADIITTDNEESLKSFLINSFKKVPWLFKANFDNMIIVGGSARNIGKIDRKVKRYPLDISHNYILNDYDLQDIYHMVKSKNLKQRKKIEGLSKDRADIFVAAATVLYTLTDMLKIKEIKVSGKGLREGLIYEHMYQKPNSTEDILDFSIKGVLKSHNINESHAENVYNVSLKLFNYLKDLHELDDSFINIIKTAAYLHDAGISIRYYDHHKHSFYIILNSEINGLTHKELVMSAYIAAFHRNNDFDVNLCQFSGIINKLDLINIRKIGVLLKIAESLDRSMTGSVKDFQCHINEETVDIKIIADKEMALELNDASKSAGKFKEVYNKELNIYM